MTIVAASGQAEQVTTAFKRNVFGLATEVKRSGTYQGAVSLARNYTFDSAMRLCKSIDPESGATVFNYDSANNLAWSASGQALPDTTPSACERASVPASAKAVHSYNARNQRISTTFGDNGAPLVMTYTPDNLIETATAGTGNAAVKWQYGYNKRRLGTTETLTVAGQNYAIGWSYTPNGHPRTITYPDSSAVDYSPSALGEATEAGSYATNVNWAPNGGLAGFTYGNGIVHGTEQNARGLPSRSYDTGVLDTYVGYDQNGNPKELTDATLGSLDNRTPTIRTVPALPATTSTRPQRWSTCSSATWTRSHRAS